MKKKTHQRGSTMVSVLAAFAILMIGIAMFTTAMLQSLKVVRESQEIREEVRSTTKAYYTGGGVSENLSGEETSGPLRAFTLESSTGNQGFALQGEVYSFREQAEDEAYTLFYFRGTK